MAFWIDPLALLGIGAVIAWFSKQSFEGSEFAIYGAEILVLTGTYVISIGLFLNVELFRPLWTMMGAQTGTAFMINGGLFGFVDAATTWTQLEPGTMVLAIVLFVLYPVCLRLGVILGRILVGRNPKQSGLVGLLNPN